jgi:hypothetical protein
MGGKLCDDGPKATPDSRSPHVICTCTASIRIGRQVRESPNSYSLNTVVLVSLG